MSCKYIRVGLVYIITLVIYRDVDSVPLEYLGHTLLTKHVLQRVGWDEIFFFLEINIGLG